MTTIQRQIIDDGGKIAEATDNTVLLTHYNCNGSENGSLRFRLRVNGEIKADGWNTSEAHAFVTGYKACQQVVA